MTFLQNTKRTTSTILLLVALSFVLVACGDVDDNDNGDESGIYEGEHSLMVQPVFSPDPPQSGEVELTLELTVDGDPLEGAEVGVVPWMPAHDHGSNTDAMVVEDGEGIYRVEDLSFSMPGLWELRVDAASSPKNSIS